MTDGTVPFLRIEMTASDNTRWKIAGTHIGNASGLCVRCGWVVVAVVSRCGMVVRQVIPRSFHAAQPSVDHRGY